MEISKLSSESGGHLFGTHPSARLLTILSLTFTTCETCIALRVSGLVDQQFAATVSPSWGEGTLQGNAHYFIIWGLDLTPQGHS